MACPLCHADGTRVNLSVISGGGGSTTFTVTADNVQGGRNVGLSAIARLLGKSDESALTPAEKVAAPSGWAGYLGFAKRLAVANGMSWSGPPSWGTSPTLQVGQVLTIPGGAGSTGLPLWVKALGVGALIVGVAVVADKAGK